MCRFARFGTDAYLLYMQGQGLIATRKVADAERAIERFERATELAPDFAAAYAAQADARLHLMHIRGLGTRVPEMIATQDKVRPLIEHALALDSSLGEAYVLRAEIRTTQNPEWVARARRGAQAGVE